MDSTNPEPLPTYQIPFSLLIEGKEQTGKLRPVDNHNPAKSCMVWTGDKWIGTLHNFNNTWHFDNKDLQYIKCELGEFVTLWHR